MVSDIAPGLRRAALCRCSYFNAKIRTHDLWFACVPTPGPMSGLWSGRVSVQFARSQGCTKPQVIDKITRLLGAQTDPLGIPKCYPLVILY